MAVVKRHSKTERFDEKKVYASVYAATLNCHKHEMEAEYVAEEVMNEVKAWEEKEDHITSAQIKQKVLEALGDEDIKLMYKHHLDLC